MKNKEHSRREEICKKITSFINQKKRYKQPIKIGELAAHLEMGRQNLSTYYIHEYKDEIHLHNKEIKKQKVQKTIDSFISRGKEITVVTIANACHVRAQYIQIEFGDQIKSLKHKKANKVTQTIEILRNINETDPLTRAEVESYLCATFSLKPTSLEQKYGYLLRTFEPRVEHRKKIWIEELVEITVSLVDRSIPPTLSFINMMREILSAKYTDIGFSEGTLIARRGELVSAINERFATDFSSFEDIKENAIIIQDDNGKNRLTKSLNATRIDVSQLAIEQIP